MVSKYTFTHLHKLFARYCATKNSKLARLRGMYRKMLFSFLGLICFFHLGNLFLWHFGIQFHKSDFQHGFEKFYQIDVSDQDPKKLDAIFSQEFHYLGHGKQMIAFESCDKKVVLKLFNPMRPLKKGWYKRWKYWKRYSSLKWISREWLHKKQRLKKLFLRHKIAYEKLREETGLLYVHLCPSEKVTHFVHLVDNKGKKHLLSLENTPFVLQEKATLVPIYLNRLIEKKELAKAQTAISALERLLEKRCDVGITDRIQTMNNNYGFVGNKPIQIDVGRLRFEKELLNDSSFEKKRILTNFQTWTHTHYPTLYRAQK